MMRNNKWQKLKQWFGKFWKLIGAIAIIIGIPASYITLKQSLEYNVTYNLNGGSGATNKTYTRCSDTIFLPINIKKEGYVFVGWYNNKNLEGDSITNIPKNSSGNKEFWAKWKPEKYIITFNSMGGSKVKKMYYTFEDEINLPESIKKGYSFSGWYNNPNFQGNNIISIPKNSSGNKKFWAKWEIEEVKSQIFSVKLKILHKHIIKYGSKLLIDDKIIYPEERIYILDMPLGEPEYFIIKVEKGQHTFSIDGHCKIYANIYKDNQEIEIECSNY